MKWNEESPKLLPYFGRRIRAERRRQNLTQEQLAAKVGISGRFLAKVEHGAESYSVVTFFRIIKALEVDPNYILGTIPKNYIDDNGWAHVTKNTFTGVKNDPNKMFIQDKGDGRAHWAYYHDPDEPESDESDGSEESGVEIFEITDDGKLIPSE